MESPPRVRDDPGMFRDENGQAIAEAALVLPAVLVLLLLTVQLTQLQRARILVEAAAFSAARAGIVLNGDPARMQEAAAVALLPGFGRTDSLAAVARTLARFKAERARLEPLGLRMLRVHVHGPAASDFATWGRHLDGQEIDFDDVRPGAAEATLLSLQVRHLCELRVPFANRMIQTIWMAARSGLPGKRHGAPDEVPLAALAAAGEAGRYYLPVEAFVTMRMQSNPYRKWARP